MAQDYITDDEESLNKLLAEEEPIVDEPIYDVDPEPEIEELTEPGETMEELIKRKTAYRKVRPGFPLDHLFLCSECFKEGICGFKQVSCPSCGLPLIAPKNVVGTPTQREKVRP